MALPLKYRWLLLVFVAAQSSSGRAQDLIWIQPYSGNIVYGPLATGEELPKCPDCDCEHCQPRGVKGFFKKLWGGAGNCVRTARQESYHFKQQYHTNYTRPLIPPYCQPGHGYYETSWRPGPRGPGISPPGVMRPPEVDGPWAAPVPVVPAPAPLNPPPELGPKSKWEGKEKDDTPPMKGNAPPVRTPGDGEKPRYEEPVPQTTSLQLIRPTFD